jgi:hypothetical protein
LKIAKPGWSDTVDALVRAAGGDDVNVVQQAYYSGHYGFAGVKLIRWLQKKRTLETRATNVS